MGRPKPDSNEPWEPDMPFTDSQEVAAEEVKDPVAPLVDSVDVEPEEIKEPVAPVFLDPVEEQATEEQQQAPEPKRARGE